MPDMVMRRVKSGVGDWRWRRQDAGLWLAVIGVGSWDRFVCFMDGEEKGVPVEKVKEGVGRGEMREEGLPPPALSPMAVTLAGSPPNPAMFSCTHRKAVA